MPLEELDSYNSIAFADVLVKVLERLRAVFTQTDFVRVVAAPEDFLVEYRAEDGLLVHVSSPMPYPKTGGGRYAMRTARFVTVIITTLSLTDYAGSDEKAVLAHVAREESVANALHGNPPVGSAYNNRVGTIIEWVDGGDDIVRRIKTDPGMMVSALRFRVEYTAPMRVLRDNAI